MVDYFGVVDDGGDEGSCSDNDYVVGGADGWCLNWW